MRIALLLLLTGCLDQLVPLHAPSSSPRVVHRPLVPADAFEKLNGPADAHAELCENDGMHPNFPADADAITRAFCADAVPAPRGLAELQQLLGLDFKDPGGENGAGGNPAFALAGASSSLVARFVSAINPRAFVFTPPPADGSKPTGYAILSFTRGETFAEVAVHDPTLDDVNFYLVRFDKACSAGGCGPDALLTPEVERGWQNVRVYESSTALGNTVADCLQCHQPDANGGKLLRMPEHDDPFTHFFSANTDGGRALLADFHAAHDSDEGYGPIPAALIDKSDPSLLRDLVDAAGFAEQPNRFDSAAIESEVLDSAPRQPVVNDPPGRSETWTRAYEAAVAGRFIATPYHDVKVTDAKKLSKMSEAYRHKDSQPLPDLRDVFLDAGLRDMGFAPRLGLDGRGLLVELCAQCHNARLDQTLTRAKFNVDALDTMSREEKDKAIQRLLKDDTEAVKMPPVLFRTITDEERDLVIAELKR